MIPHFHGEFRMPATSLPGLDIEEIITIISRWAHAGLVREFPSFLPQVLQQPSKISSPRELWPVFYGCFDWHSAVHSHWALARYVRWLPSHPQAVSWIETLQYQITPSGMAGEFAFFTRSNWPSFERPYGWAWYLTLCLELASHPEPALQNLYQYLQPLEQILRGRFRDWLESLDRPIRTGEHNQTAFSLGMIYDYSKGMGDDALRMLITRKSLSWHARDTHLPWALEPSAHDFLSPSLAVADLLSRTIDDPEEFSQWLRNAFPQWHDDSATLLEWPTVESLDRIDGKNAHWDGLAFSRAWMLLRIAQRLPHDHHLKSAFIEASHQHGRRGLNSLTSDSYMTTHWVGSFVAYWLSFHLSHDPHSDKPSSSIA